jgi:hypothetical protein
MTLLPIRLLLLCAVLCCAGSRLAAAEDSPLDIAMGAKVFAEQCWRCHEPPDPASRDGRAWRTVSLHMRIYACIDRQEQQQLLAFLRYQCTVRAPEPAPSNNVSK